LAFVYLEKALHTAVGIYGKDDTMRSVILLASWNKLGGMQSKRRKMHWMLPQLEIVRKKYDVGTLPEINPGRIGALICGPFSLTTSH
jgi:hypothetical protein